MGEIGRHGPGGYRDHVDESHPVVVFDGVCNLCNAAVDFLLRHDRSGSLRFASAQGDTGAALLGIEPDGDGNVPDPSTIVVAIEGTVLERSDAVLALVPFLGWPWKAALIGRALPRPVRDRLYDLVARNRYRWFGKKETCRIPTPDERARFVDTP